MRKLRYTAEVVEHRRGSFVRKDLFDVADVLAFHPLEGIVMIQAYHKSKAKQHSWLDQRNNTIVRWLASGGKFQHHLWKKKKGRWHVEVIEIKV